MVVGLERTKESVVQPALRRVTQGRTVRATQQQCWAAAAGWC